MTVVRGGAGLQGLGLPAWLTPPKWLRDLGAQALSATRVTVPTPFGPYVIDPSNADQVATLKRLLSGAQVQIGQPQPSVVDRANDAVKHVPGGWIGVTLGAGALGLLAFALAKGAH